MTNIIKSLVLAGKAIFTIDNGKGQHFTYKVNKKDFPITEAEANYPNQKGQKTIYFISVLTGPDNTSNYTYMGTLIPSNGRVHPTAKSKISEDALSFKVASWALRVLWMDQQLPDGYSARHAGRCCRCGRMLTDPESIEAGLGPECRSIMGVC